MPELPEVETVCRGIHNKIHNEILERVDLRRPNLRFVIPPSLPDQAKGQKIIKIHRRNKYALIDLENNVTIMIHLGMSGRIVFHDTPDFDIEKHDHVIFYIGDGTVMVLNDPRRFGMVDCIATDQLNTHRLIKNIGLDPFDKKLNPQWLGDKFKGKKSSIKAALLDQRIIAGLGNIYVCEALFRSNIHPSISAGKIKKAQLPILLNHIRAVLAEAIAAGGSSLKDYVQTTGELGYFQKEFQVYGRAGDACFTCQTPIERIVQSGRSSFYCPNCQSN